MLNDGSDVLFHLFDNDTDNLIFIDFPLFHSKYFYSKIQYKLKISDYQFIFVLGISFLGLLQKTIQMF